MKKINLDYLALGQNIGSSSFKRFYRVSAKAHLTVSPILNEILIGSMLGDLTVEKPNLNCNARIQFKQSIINKDYIEHMYELFKEFCGSKPLVMSKFLGCGCVYAKKDSKFAEFTVDKFSDIDGKIIPFFSKYPLEGIKRLDYEDFVKVALLIKEKTHLTEEGLEQARQIKSGINRGRKF